MLVGRHFRGARRKKTIVFVDNANSSNHLYDNEIVVQQKKLLKSFKDLLFVYKCNTLYYMVKYIEEVLKRVRKGLIPKEIFMHFNNAFISLDLTKDLTLFDIKQLRVSEETKRIYYRLRKGKYRAIFYIEEFDIFVIAIDKREEVYKKWQ